MQEMQSTFYAAAYPTPGPSAPFPDSRTSSNFTPDSQSQPAWTIFGSNQHLGPEVPDEQAAPHQTFDDQTDLNLARGPVNSYSISTAETPPFQPPQSPPRQPLPPVSAHMDVSLSALSKTSSRSSSRLSSPLSTPPSSPSRPSSPTDENNANPGPNPNPGQKKDSTTPGDQNPKDKNPKDKDSKDKNPKDKDSKAKNPKDKDSKAKNPKDKDKKKRPRDGRGEGVDKGKGKGRDDGKGPRNDSDGKLDRASVSAEVVELLTPQELNDVFEDLNITSDHRPAQRVTSRGTPFIPTGDGPLPRKKLRRVVSDTTFKVYDIDGIEEEYTPAVPVCVSLLCSWLVTDVGR